MTKEIIKCKCGVELCNKDVIDWGGTLYNWRCNLWEYDWKKYRCPKCFKTKLIKFGTPIRGQLIEVK